MHDILHPCRAVKACMNSNSGMRQVPILACFKEDLRLISICRLCVAGAGMMCICSAAREMGLDTSDLPLHIYGPPGLAEYLR